jgi:hypothetical protein
MSNKGCKPTGIWEILQNIDRIKSTGCPWGFELDAVQHSKRMIRKANRKKRGR